MSSFPAGYLLYSSALRHQSSTLSICKFRSIKHINLSDSYYVANDFGIPFGALKALLAKKKLEKLKNPNLANQLTRKRDGG